MANRATIIEGIFELAHLIRMLVKVYINLLIPCILAPYLSTPIKRENHALDPA